MRLNQAILDELKHQAQRQASRNYKQVEVPCGTLLAMIHEIERSRLVDLRFERATEKVKE